MKDKPTRAALAVQTLTDLVLFILFQAGALGALMIAGDLVLDIITGTTPTAPPFTHAAAILCLIGLNYYAGLILSRNSKS